MSASNQWVRARRFCRGLLFLGEAGPSDPTSFDPNRIHFEADLCAAAQQDPRSGVDTDRGVKIHIF